MASLNYFVFASILCKIFLLILLSNIPNVVSQEPSPTIDECTPKLTILIPCLPFVEGNDPSPGPECCGNLKQIYTQESQCLCLFFNSSNSGYFPVNRTLALQLPALCSLGVNPNMSACLGGQMHMPATSPLSQASFGRKNNSTVTASPAFSLAPRPSMMGFRFGTSKATNLNTRDRVVVIAIVVTLLFTSLLY